MSSKTPSNTLIIRSEISPPILFSFLLFVFIVPFENIAVLSHTSLAKMLGYLFIFTTILQFKRCYQLPHRIVWCFVIWVIVYFISGIIHDPIYLGIINPYYYSLVFLRSSQYVQSIVLFWLCVNIMKDEVAIIGAWICIALSGVTLALLSKIDSSTITANSEITSARITSMGLDHNAYACYLVIGLVALIGLAYGKVIKSNGAKVILYVFAGLILHSIAQTGSRTGTLALFAGILPFMIMRVSAIGAWRNRVIAFLLFILISFVYLNVDVARKRWEETIFEGSTAKRTEIFAIAWQTFLDHPILGVGPQNNLYYIGMALYGMESYINTHNLYLWILTEVGLVGAIPFFLALLMCVQAAFRARHGPQGLVPLSLLSSILALNITLTWHTRKLFWLVLAYVIASGYSKKIEKKEYKAPSLLT